MDRSYEDILTDFEFLDEQKKMIQERMDAVNLESFRHFEIKEGDKVTVFDCDYRGNRTGKLKHGFAGFVTPKNCKPDFNVLAVKKDGSPSLNNVAVYYGDKIEKGWE